MLKINSKGFTLPILPILICIIVVLCFFWGWIVLAYVTGIVVLIPICTAIYDRITHDAHCRYCNKIKQEFSEQKSIEVTRLTTKHEQDFDDHMLIRIYIDSMPDALIDIDYNEMVLCIDENDVLVDEPYNDIYFDLCSHSRATLLYDSLDDYQAVIEALTSHLKQDPTCSAAYNNRALAFWETGKLGNAVHDFKRSAGFANDHVPLKNWGMLLRDNGKLTEAIDKFSQAIQLAPKDPYLRRTRADAFYKLKKYKQALEDFSKAIEIAPDFKHTYLDRAKVYKKLGMKQKANEDLHKAKQ